LTCDHCRAQRLKKQAVRIRKGLTASWERAELAPERWNQPCECEHGSKCQRARARAGNRTMCVMLTLTLKDTGDIAADRANLEAGWRRFYRRYLDVFGAFEYVATHEITPGRARIGHPHMHVVALWPFRCWKMLRRWWLNACPQSARIYFKGSTNVKRASAYISKYVAKGVETSDWSPELRARALHAYYGTRWFSTSEGFFSRWVTICPCCGQPYRQDMFVPSWVESIIRAQRAENCRGSPGRHSASADGERCYQGTLEGFS
jgi:hypothetical protein